MSFSIFSRPVRRNGCTEELRAGELRVGDVVVIKPRSRISVDGVVTGGHSFVDQSAITGESLPVEKLSGAAVYAGTINQTGVLEIGTRGTGRDTAFGRIIAAVEQAERSRAPIQKVADRLAGYLVYFALGCAAVTFLATRDAPFNDFRRDCRWRLWNRGRHSSGDSPWHRPCRTELYDHQRWTISRKHVGSKDRGT
jgi:P-type E1-E2 ATPase